MCSRRRVAGLWVWKCLLMPLLFSGAAGCSPEKEGTSGFVRKNLQVTPWRLDPSTPSGRLYRMADRLDMISIEIPPHNLPVQSVQKALESDTMVEHIDLGQVAWVPVTGQSDDLNAGSPGAPGLERSGLPGMVLPPAPGPLKPRAPVPPGVLGPALPPDPGTLERRGPMPTAMPGAAKPAERAAMQPAAPGGAPDSSRADQGRGKSHTTLWYIPFPITSLFADGGASTENKAQQPDIYCNERKLELASDLSTRRQDPGFWMFRQGGLYVTTKPGKNPGRLVIEATHPLGEHRDWQYMLWKGPVETFVHRRILLEDQYKDGLFLPAPAMVQDRLTIPPGARFEASVGRVPLSSGMPIRPITLAGTIKDEETGLTSTLFSIRIEPSSVAQQAWHDVSVDLEHLAGHTVTLTLTSAPGKDSIFDYAFFGHPRIVMESPLRSPSTPSQSADTSSQSADTSSQSADTSSQSADTSSQSADTSSQSAGTPSQSPGTTSQTRPLETTRDQGSSARETRPTRETAAVSPGARPLNVLLIVIDTLRADHVSKGGGLAKTPALDRLAAKGFRFPNAFCTSCWTAPSMTSIFTGLYPLVFSSDPTDFDDTAPPLFGSAPNLVRLLQRQGWTTSAFQSNPMLTSEGWCRGFDEYRLVNDASAKEVTDHAIQWLSSHRFQQPFLLYAHYLDPHLPYQYHPHEDEPEPQNTPRMFDRSDSFPTEPDPPAIDQEALDAFQRAERSQRASLLKSDAEKDQIRRLYRGEVEYTDWNIGRLVDWLERYGVLSQTLVVVTNDHGEELWDHGDFEHGHSFHQEVGRALLIIRPPLVVKQRLELLTAGAGKVPQERMASLVDIFPTITGVLGLEAPHPVQGHDLFGPPAPDQPLFGEITLYGAPQRAVYTQRFTLLGELLKTGSLFDRAVDPGELANVAGRNPGTIEDLDKAFASHLEACASLHQQLEQIPPETPVKATPIRPETLEQLQEMGYIRK